MEPSAVVPQPSPLPSLPQDEERSLLDITPEKKLRRLPERSGVQKIGDFARNARHVGHAAAPGRLAVPALNTTAKLQHAVHSLKDEKMARGRAYAQSQLKENADPDTLLFRHPQPTSRALKVKTRDIVRTCTYFNACRLDSA